MVWMFPAAGGAKDCSHYFDDWLIALWSDTTYIVVGPLVRIWFSTARCLLSDFLWPLRPSHLPEISAAAQLFRGNGSHAQIRNDMSKRKEEARLRGNARNGSGKAEKQR